MNVRDDGDAHRRRATLPALAALVLVAVWITAAVLLWHTEVPTLRLPALRSESFFPARELARIDAFHRVSRGLFLGSLAAQVVVLAFLALAGERLASRLAPLGRGRVRTAVFLGLLAAVAVWLAVLPFDGVFHWWSRRYGLSHQGYAAWLGDEAVALLVRSVLVAIAVAVVAGLAGRLGRRWWIAGGPVLAVAAVAVTLLLPVVVQPLLTSSHALRDRALAARLEAIAARMGVHLSGIDVEVASAQTTAANAEEVGIGPSDRVVLWDTLLDGRFSRAEIEVVAAHEFGHVKRHHVWKGLAWFALIVIPGALVLARLSERVRPGGLAHPGLVPFGLFLAFALFLATLPLQNAVSRRYEAEADWLALQATHDPRAMVGLQEGFVRTSLGDPSPPRWVDGVFDDHPTPLRRIGMALAFRSRAAPGGS